MKQIVQNYRSGELLLAEVPAPALKSGGVLVRTLFSAVSPGTEMMKIGESRLSLVGKARARPDQVKKVLTSISQQGLAATYRKVESQLDSWTPLGYSLSGEVIEVGRGVDQFEVGQIVACAGNQFAFHAEINWVPVNLCALMPKNVDPQLAAFTTVGAVAMQGFRQSQATLGEIAVVIGLGLVGQLLVQILRAAGLRVIGIDLSQERCDLAQTSGGAFAAPPTPEGLVAIETWLREISSGHGADHVFITAGGDSNTPVELAARLIRDRGRVVDIGKTRLDLPWKDYYEKELDVRFSRSYGPGRYDPTYEDGGVDYPIGYVRWTEQRNMSSFLNLLGEGRIDLRPLVSAVFPFEEAVSAYDRISSGEEKGVGVLFRYSESPATARRLPRSGGVHPNTTSARLTVSAVGAGNYATSMLLPNLQRDDRVRLKDVVTTTALSAANSQRRFAFESFGTDTDAVLADPATDVILIATRHASHASLVCKALRAGKAVFVEKPLAISIEELEEIIATVAETGNDRLMVGFNRRFAPLLVEMRHHWNPAGSVHFAYSINAGPLAESSWYRDPSHGSRFVGEGGHFIDTASWWIGEDPVSVQSAKIGDGLTASLTYPDGSTAQISYLGDGHPRYPKERIEVFGQGRVARLDNFRSMEIWETAKTIRSKARSVDKGQAAQLGAFVDALTGGGAMPIPLESLLSTTAATLIADEAAVDGSKRRTDTFRPARVRFSGNGRLEDGA